MDTGEKIKTIEYRKHGLAYILSMLFFVVLIYFPFVVHIIFPNYKTEINLEHFFYFSTFLALGPMFLVLREIKILFASNAFDIYENGIGGNVIKFRTGHKIIPWVLIRNFKIVETNFRGMKQKFITVETYDDYKFWKDLNIFKKILFLIDILYYKTHLVIGAGSHFDVESTKQLKKELDAYREKYRK